jgi:alpha-glucoside transport system substrate-binding protein
VSLVPGTPTALAKDPSPLEEALAGKYEGTTITLRASWQMFPPVDFEEKTGIHIKTLSTSNDYEQGDALAKMIEAGQGPDIYEFYMPTHLRELARQGKVVDVGKFLDRDTLQARYGQEWLDWATMPGPSGPTMAGVWAEAYVYSLVWYPKAAFDQAGYQVPATWEELLALSDQIVKDGGTPWCIQNGDSSTAAHWINDIMLRTAPLEDYDKWIRGELAFSSPQVKHAVELMSDLWFKEGYAYGGRKVLNNYYDTSIRYHMFAKPPKCWLLKEPNWLIADNVTKQLGKDYAFFVLPAIDPAYGAPVQVDGHFIAMFNDRPEVRALMEYFTTSAQVEGWAKLGKVGFSPHQEARLDWYRGELDRAVAEVVQNAPSLRYWAGDLMPLAVDNQFQKSMADYVAGTVDLDTALQQVDAAWPTPAGAILGGNLQRTGVYDTPGPQQGKLKWKVAIKVGDIPPIPAVADGLVYCGSSDGYLYAVDVQTGQEKWKFKTADVGTPSVPTVAAGVVYVGSQDHHLYALDAQTGQEKWRFKTGGWVGSSPAMANGVVYVGSDDHYLYALDSQTGQEKWRFETGDQVWSEPAIATGVVYVGSTDHYLYAVDAATGQEKWRFEAADIIYTSPALAEGRLYLTSGNGYLYALDSQTGQEKWRFDTKGGSISAPAVAAGLVYVGNMNGRLYTVDAQTGQEKWQFKTKGIVGTPAIAGEVLYVDSSDGCLYAVDRQTGQQKWWFKATPFTDMSRSPTIAAGVAYIASTDGHLYAIQ